MVFSKEWYSTNPHPRNRLGKHLSEDNRRRISEKLKGVNSSGMGESHGRWKGDAVGIKALHEWVRRHKPKPELCEECKLVPPRDLANISQHYKRDINDFEWLCRKCHMIKDGRIPNLPETGPLLCRGCGIPKQREDFYVNKGRPLQPCKSCRKGQTSRDLVGLKSIKL